MILDNFTQLQTSDNIYILKVYEYEINTPKYPDDAWKRRKFPCKLYNPKNRKQLSFNMYGSSKVDTVEAENAFIDLLRDVWDYDNLTESEYLDSYGYNEGCEHIKVGKKAYKITEKKYYKMLKFLNNDRAELAELFKLAEKLDQ